MKQRPGWTQVLRSFSFLKETNQDILTNKKFNHRRFQSDFLINFFHPRKTIKDMTINWRQFKKENLVAKGKPTFKEVETENGKVTNWSIPLEYKLDNGTKEYFEVFYPTMKSYAGIRMKEMKSYTKYQISGSLESEVQKEQDDLDEFQTVFAGPLNERIIELIADNYENMKKSKGKPAKDRIAAYRPLIEAGDAYMEPFFIKKDEDNNPAVGAVYKTVIPLKNFDNRKTKFTDIKKNPLLNPDTGKPGTFEDSVDLLSGISFKFRPCVAFPKIDVGVKFKIASMMSSSIVWDFTESSDDSHQDEDCEELQQQYGESKNDESIQKLAELKKGKMGKGPLSTTKTSSEKEEVVSGTVYSGGKNAKPAVGKATVQKPKKAAAPPPEPEQSEDNQEESNQEEGESNQEDNDAAPTDEDPEATQVDEEPAPVVEEPKFKIPTGKSGKNKK
jgi:hypothetical protein